MQLSSGNKIAKNTLFLYLRMLLIMLVSFYTVRVVLNTLGVEDYGIYNAIGGVVTSLSFLTQVLANASQRFFAIEIGKGSQGKVQEYISSILFSYVIISAFIFVVVEVAGLWLIHNKLTIPPDRILAATTVLHVSLVTFIVSVIGTPFNALIIAKEEMNVFAYISIFDVVAKLAIVFLLLKSPFDKLVTYSFLLLIVSLLTSFFYIVFSIRKTAIRITIEYNRQNIKEIASYSAWTLVGTVSGVLGIQGNSIILNIFCGPIANAAFAISQQVSNTVQQFASSFFSAVRPPLTKGYAAREYDYMMKLFYFSNKVIFSLVYVVVFPLFVETDFVLNLWLSNTSEYMSSFVRIMLAYALVLSLNNPITTIVQAAGKVKLYHCVVDGFALLVLPVSYIILKVGLSPSYALFSMVVVFCISHVLRLVILKKVIAFSYSEYIQRFVVPCIVIIVVCAVYVLVTNGYWTSSVTSSIVNIVLCIAIALLSTVFILFSREERKQCLEMIRNRN